jgi:hypothetical protein
MRGLIEHLRIALQLSVRNPLALVYGYVLPVAFLISFLVLFRAEERPLLRHMGGLLTISILAGACFALPMSLVSERERGVWRRYRLAPIATGALVGGTLIARFVAVLGAITVQLGLAMIFERWVPAHPIALAFVCSLVILALLGVGLVVAALANTVPAAQALGQCLFLPMLIIGGVAVEPESLPAWAQPVTALFPGRYAVEALQACVNGAGIGGLNFHLAALTVIAAASCLVGAKLFRWDAGARSLSWRQRSWVAGALASWVVVGVVAIQRGTLVSGQRARPVRSAAAVPVTPASPSITPPSISAPVAPSAPLVTAPPASAPVAPALKPVAPAPEPWRALTTFDFAALPIDQMPPDDGNISPIARDDELPEGSSLQQLLKIESALPVWAPGHVADRVQRVRNCLLLLGVADFAQSPIERFLPSVVLDHLRKEFPRDELAQLIAWVALHPDEGTASVMTDPLLVELGAATLDPTEVRTRTYYYGVKFTRRVLGW